MGRENWDLVQRSSDPHYVTKEQVARSAYFYLFSIVSNLGAALEHKRGRDMRRAQKNWGGEDLPQISAHLPRLRLSNKILKGKSLIIINIGPTNLTETTINTNSNMPAHVGRQDKAGVSTT